MVVANLFPEETEWADVTEEPAESTVSFGRSWRFDFDAGEFVMTPTQKIAKADDTAAWVQWCQKALRTPRYRHLIYSQNHGQEFDDLIGKGYERSIIESEIQRMVTEALMVDPRTAEVGQFQFSWQSDACYYSCRIMNIREETENIEGNVVI